jgi:thiamine transport system substrate-binding protein
MRNKIISILALMALVLAGCASGGEATAPPQVTGAAETRASVQAGERTLAVMTHDSFAVSEEVVNAFQDENQVKVQFIQSGDVGTALNRAILSKGNPLADVFYGVDNTFLSRALAEDIFEPYHSPLLAEIPEAFRLDPENRALPVDYGDVCLNYDKGYFEENNLAPPTGLEDLTEPDYQGLLVVENPATSSPGLAFLLATIGHFGPEGYLDYWLELKANDLLVVNDWETAYNGEFSVHGGTRPIVVSYGSSPPAEVIFAEQPVEDAPTAAVTGDESCFRQIEFAGILQGTENRDLAEKWIDFMLSERFQEDMPLQMFVFPVNPDAELPEEFQKYATIPEQTAQVKPDDIAANRETWLQEWTEAVLR